MPDQGSPASPGWLSPGSLQWKPPTPEELQAQLPEYKILDLLGCGGMGAVYQGWQTSLERYVAIKILPPGADEGDAQFTERFKREAKTMAKFQHPGIVSVYDAGETATGLLYIVMEFIEGTDVAKMVKAQGKLLPAHALAITAHVCDALQYAHEHGVMHRDIKPANVLMNLEGSVKVADFGLAKGTDHSQAGLTMGDMAMGTPDYLAPEALIAGMNVDGRADLYAVGVMLYNMLTGQVPRGMFEMPSALTRGETDARFDAIIARAMEQDREKRYQSAAEIRRDLNVILTTPKLEAHGPASRAIPKHELAVVHHDAARPKPVARRPGELARVQAGRMVTYVPQKRSMLPAVAAGVVLTAGAYLGWQKFGNHPPPTVDVSASTAAQPAVSPAVSPAAGTVLPEGVFAFDGHRYMFLPGPFGKNEDSDKAAALGGHLVTITSAEEQKWIEETFADVISVNSKGQCRAGGNRANDGTWSWMTGEPWSYTNWAAGFPRDNSDLILLFSHKEGELKWQATYWSFKRSAIIEWDDTTTPIPTAALAAPLASAMPAPADALPFGGHRYKLIRGLVSWNEASNQAADLGGHLVTLTSREEDAWVRATFVDDLPRERVLLIGAFKPLGSKQWLWITGEPWGFEHWRTKDDTTDARGATYQQRPDGNSAWVGVWTPANRMTFLSGSEQGQPRTVGFIVEWDDDRVSAPALANTSVPAKPEAVGSVADGAPINLLAGVDVKRDAVRGNWELRAGEPLLDAVKDSGVKGSAAWQFLCLRTAAPEEYDFEVEFTIVSGRPYFSQVLPVPGKIIEWKAQPTQDDSTLYYGFGPKLDNLWMPEGQRTEARLKGPELSVGSQRHRSLVEVRKGSLRAVLDGQEMVKWSGDFKRLDRTDKNWPDLRFPGIGGMNTVIIYHKAELREAGVLSRRLAKLEDQFQEAWERDVTKSSAGQAIADLDGKYLAALDRALADATKTGKLDEVIALTAEKRRVTDKAPLPAADTANIVSSLKKLRDTYRKSLAPLIKKRDPAADLVYARYDEALSALEVELMEKNATGDAQTVKNLRETLKKQRQPATAESMIAAASLQAAPSSPIPAAPAPRKDDAKKTAPPAVLPPEMLNEPVPKPFTPPQAVQWALSLGGSAKIKKGSVESEVLSVANMPRGSYTVIGLKLGEKQPLHVVSLAALSGLTDLRELTLDNNLITDAGLAFLPKLPKLDHLSLEGCGLSDAGLEHLARQSALTHLGLTNNPITGSGLRSIAGLQSLTTLEIGSPSLADEHIATIASFGGLTTLDFSGDKALTCTNFAPLADIKTLKRITLGRAATDQVVQSLGTLVQLDTLDLNRAPISDYAFERVGTMKGLRELNLYACPNLTDVGFAKLQPLKGLLKLNAGRTRLTDGQFVTLSTKLSELTELDINTNGMSDAGLASLANLRKVSKLNIHARMCTDLGLGYVRRLANLRVISIDQINTLSPARMDALRRGLPNVDFGRR